MNTTLRTAPHYFIIESIGGMNEGYSTTTCRRIEDVVAPEYGKAMVEEYIDQWAHEHLEYYTNLAEEQMVPTMDVRYDIEECPHGGWVRLTPKFSDNTDPTDIEDWGFHTLFIQVYDGVMLGDGVVVYDQTDDMVRTITHRSTAIRMAEEVTSAQVEYIKQKVYEATNHGGWDRHYTNRVIEAYDNLAEVVRDLEYPQNVMVDVDDTCLHFFPIQAMRQMVYNGSNKITTP